MAKLREILASAREINIWHNWTGLSPLSPIVAKYGLKRAKDGFKGIAHFSVGWPAATAKEKIHVAAAIINKFLDNVGELPFSKNAYLPLLHHTDDYPDLGIEIVASGGKLLLHSRSQGEGHSPRELMINKVKFVVSCTVPYNVIIGLEPQMKVASLRKLQEENTNRRAQHQVDN